MPAFFFALVLQGLSSGAVRVVWPWACQRRGCAPVGILPVRTSHRRGRVREWLCMVCRCPIHTGRCVPPSAASEFRNDSTCCGGGRQPHDRLPVHASHCRGRVRKWLYTVWRWPTRPPNLCPGVDVSRCAPPTVADESGNGSARCSVGRLPPPLTKRGRLPVRPLHL
jgi:hypothetical protein